MYSWCRTNQICSQSQKPRWPTKSYQSSPSPSPHLPYLPTAATPRSCCKFSAATAWRRTTSKPASFLATISHYLATFFNINRSNSTLRWCKGCEAHHSRRTICFPLAVTFTAAPTSSTGFSREREARGSLERARSARAGLLNPRRAVRACERLGTRQQRHIPVWECPCHPGSENQAPVILSFFCSSGGLFIFSIRVDSFDPAGLGFSEKCEELEKTGKWLQMLKERRELHATPNEERFRYCYVITYKILQ